MTINIIWAWIMTIPVSAGIGALTYFIVSHIPGLAGQ
jgi:phosphate/sulfate permease